MEINLVIFGTAFAAGLATFFSPCVLPLVPIYLLYLSGTTAKEVLIRKRARTLILSLGFVLGIATIFSALGASASFISTLLFTYRATVEKIAGAVVIFLGLNVMGVITFRPLLRHYPHEIKVKRLAGNFLSAFLVGISFGLSWTPCVGLELGAFYLLASQEATVWQGAGLLFTFALGLGLPFILAGLTLERFDNFYKKIGRHLRKIQIVSGLMTCLLGLLVFTGQVDTLHNWLALLF